MQRIEIRSTGSPNNLKAVSAEIPKPKKGELLIQCKAVGINFADILIRKGLHPDAPEPPITPGFEASGIVTSIGESVDPSWLGQEVFAITPNGSYSEYFCTPSGLAFTKPERLSFEVAASLPIVYLTAWQSLVVMGSLAKDDTLLLHNAGGAFGIAAVEIAKDIGCTIIGTASAAKHDFLHEQGVDHAIDYTQKDWEREVMALTDQKGVELIIDPIGGTHWKKSYECLRSTGRLALFGISTALNAGKGRTLPLIKTAMQMPFYHPIALMNSNKGVFGVSMNNLWQEPEKSQHWMQQILSKVQSGAYQPHIDKTFSLDEASQAHEYIEARKNRGKVIITL